jgi:integrase
MEIYFKSVFREEIAQYIELVKISAVDHKAYQCTLADLDSFLFGEGSDEKVLTSEQLSRWLGRFDVKPSTKQSKLTHVRRFAGYLRTLGIKTSLPELPRVPSDFEPYIFTIEEMERIFDAADDLILTRPSSRIAAEFPVLLRILYGCGLRLGEAMSLTWDDVDLHEGVLTVREAKNRKQRIVPMSGELTRILTLYRNAPCYSMKDHDFLFRKEDGARRGKSSYWRLFDEVLCGLGIKGAHNYRFRSRGPCIHSLRHVFVLHSFLKAEAEGRTFIETVPFLSTYLGHSGLTETEKYLKARHEMYRESHEKIAAYTVDVFPEDD